MFSTVWAGDLPLSQPFGWTTLSVEPLWNGKHFHCGIDVPMKVGTPLYAARAGKVARIGSGFLAIEVGDAEVDWYIHIDVALVAINSNVSRGQLIARSGNKSAGGTVIGSGHLHFETQHSAHAYSGQGGSSTVNNAGQPGNLNYPATALNPAGALAGRFSAGEGELMATVDDLLASGGELRGKGGNSKLDTMVGPNGLGGGQLDRIEVLLKGVAASEAAEVAQAVADAHALQDKLTAGFADLKAALAVNTAQGFADLKLAIDGLKVAGGGLTPEQDAEVSAIEAGIEQLKQQLAAGLKVDITAIGKP